MSLAGMMLAGLGGVKEYGLWVGQAGAAAPPHTIYTSQAFAIPYRF